MSSEALRFSGVEVGAGGKSMLFDDPDVTARVDVLPWLVVSCLFRKSPCLRTSNVSVLSPKCTSTL